MQPIRFSLMAAPAAARPRASSMLITGFIVLAVSLFATSVLMPNAGNAQDAIVVKSMEALKADTTKLGAPEIEGTEDVGGKAAPALYFGSTKMNNNFAVVDEIAKAGGKSMAATLLVKSDGDFIPVATDGKSRMEAAGRLGLSWPAPHARCRSSAPAVSPTMSRSRMHLAP